MITMQPNDSDLLSNRDLQMLDRALSVASAGNQRQRHGALIYRSGRVLGVGINTHRNKHPTMEIDFAAYTSHAEINAMRSVGYANLEGSTLYVVRFSPTRLTPMYSKPCAACRQALMSNGIKRVVYSV